LNTQKLLQSLDLSSFTAFDFETTGLDPINDRIIEIAAIRFENGEIVDRFVSLVNPGRNIPAIISDITGISNIMVSKAPNEEKIIDEFLNFLDDIPLVAHNIHFDEKFLSQLCLRHGKKEKNFIKYDTLQLARSLLFDQPVFNLSALSDYYGLSSEGAHRAENDTENTGQIFLELINEIAGYPLELISKVNSLIQGTDIPNIQLYVNLANTLIKQGDLKKGMIEQKNIPQCQTNIYSHNGKRDIQSLSADDVFGESGTLSNVHPNFESRPNQKEYAQLVNDILSENGKIGVLEAGTGLGKTMAYLFGAIKESGNVEENGPVIIACNTKHLQDQLFHKDLPLLSTALDVPIKAVMLKGRKNYICKTRFNWLISDAKTLDHIDLEALIPIVFWLFWTKTGDIAECSGFLNTRRNWLKSAISSDTGFCTSEICNRHRGCYYGNLKKNIFQAHIIVANHSLLMTNVSQEGLLPSYSSVIVDEAHNLVKAAYDQFKVEWNEQQVTYQLQTLDPSHPRSNRWNNILNNISEINSDVKNSREELKAAVQNASQYLKSFMTDLVDDNQHRYSPTKAYQDKPILGNIDKIYASTKLSLDSLKKSFEIIFSILDKMKKMILEMDPKRSDYTVLHNIIEQGLETSTVLLNTIVHLTENQNSEWVYWMEGEYRSRGSENQILQISLHASLVDVSDTLHTSFFNQLENCILTSATLKVQNSFSYFLGRIGLGDYGNVLTKDFLSPFFYNEQVSYYQYGGAREISNDSKAISELVYYLHKTFNKRIMVLFTSIKALSDTAKELRAKKDGRDLPLFAQTRGASKPAIIKGMHQNPNGILFGTNSFWEGVDLPGDLLEILVLVKLPFDVPSEPLIKSYSEYVNKMGGNSFMEYSLPEAAIRFRQGFGRLIRTSYDAGKFLCLDNRIVVKRYGEIFSQSLPVEMHTFSEFYSIK
tara:strand:+ start:577 stop:3387 length:2811 start_codon:yes stop_codon:yes gene_type:complete